MSEMKNIKCPSCRGNIELDIAEELEVGEIIYCLNLKSLFFITYKHHLPYLPQDIEQL